LIYRRTVWNSIYDFVKLSNALAAGRSMQEPVSNKVAMVERRK